MARVTLSKGKGRQQQYRFKHTAANLNDGAMSLKQQQLTFDNNKRCTNAYKFLIEPDLLLGSYGKIKSKPGNMTPGSDTTTLDGISINYIENLHKSLKDESWLPKPTRRVYIEKSNRKKRPLGISSPRDKIVQESMRKVLENVLEPKFMDCSHGFRPGRSCHSALAKIRY
jgi:retron-type reverse transcriptase